MTLLLDYNDNDYHNHCNEGKCPEQCQIGQLQMSYSATLQHFLISFCISRVISRNIFEHPSQIVRIRIPYSYCNIMESFRIQQQIQAFSMRIAIKYWAGLVCSLDLYCLDNVLGLLPTASASFPM